MTLLHWVLAAVALQRLLEVLLARQNEARLRIMGGLETGARHYPFIVLLHACWLGAMVIFVPSTAPVDWPLLASFGLLQLGRYWVIVSLGRNWTTRIITIPGTALVRRGPYRFLRHPNYLIVVAEIAVLPLAFGAWRLALVFSILNAALLAIRVRAENAALDAHCVRVPSGP